MTNENKSYLVQVSASVDIEIKANSEEEAIEKAEENWYEALQWNGSYDICWVHEV